MSSSNIRIYQVSSRANPKEIMTIRGLAVKEKEIVISNVTLSKEWQAALPSLADSDPRKKNNFASPRSLTEPQLLAHFQTLLANTVNIYDAVKGVYLNQATAPVASVTLTPVTVSKVRGTTPQQFTAVVAPSDAIQGVTFSISPVTAGLTISNTGLVTISGAVPAADYTITATSTAGGTKTDTSVLTVTTV